MKFEERDPQALQKPWWVKKTCPKDRQVSTELRKAGKNPAKLGLAPQALCIYGAKRGARPQACLPGTVAKAHCYRPLDSECTKNIALFENRKIKSFNPARLESLTIYK